MSDATATTNGQELHTEDEALSVLLDGDIDKVMSGLDKIVEAAPSYEKLFMRWQRQHWSTEDFSFEVDAKQWADPKMFTDDERRFLEFGFSEFFLGEERVTLELLPFALAAPTHEAKVFLTTQISDEAKHTVFWNGFYREVFGIEAGSLGEMIDKQRYVVNKDWETLFNGILHECAEDLRKDPSDFPKLVRGVTVYMIVIEGMLALSAARFMIKSMRERGWFPGFTAGFTAVARDESRHIGFGVLALRRRVHESPELARAIALKILDLAEPAVMTVVDPETLMTIAPPDEMAPELRQDPAEMRAFALESLAKRLRAIGLSDAAIADIESHYSAIYERLWDRYEEIHGVEHPVRWYQRQAAGAAS